MVQDQRDTQGHVKCRTCFALMPEVVERCAKCGAPQNWRRHITLSNMLGVSTIVVLFAGFYFIAPWIVRLSHPAVNAALRTSFAADGSNFTQEVVVTNRGDHQFLVHQIMSTVRDQNDEAYNVLANARTWGGAFTVGPGEIGAKHVVLHPTPGTLEHVRTRVVVYHYDGSVEVLVDSLPTTISYGKAAPVADTLPGSREDSVR